MKLFGSLERFARRPSPRAPGGERCELCASAIGDAHRHVVELERRALLCACGACAVLFGDPASGGGRFRTVPDRGRVDPSFAVDDAEWTALGIPVRLAYVTFPSRLGRWVAFYPSPGGSIEAEVPADAWSALRARSPLVESLEPDVEALLVHRPRGRPVDAVVAPIDACYALVALVRRHFRGFDGGDDAARVIDQFFAELRARCAPLRRPGRQGAACEGGSR